MGKNSVFPPQKVTLRKKTKEWKESSLEAIISRYNVDTARKRNMQISRDMMNSKFDLEDLKYVTDPYHVGEEFPARIQNINVVRPKIELLVGEETKRPDNIIVFRTDDDATESIMEKMKDMLYRAMEDSVSNQNISTDEEQMRYLQQRIQEINNYIKNEYYDPAEKVAVVSLKNLKEKLDLRDEFLQGFRDGLTNAEEIYYIGVRNGLPILERVDPKNCAYDMGSGIKFIDEGDWFVRHEWMTPATVYDQFYDLMTEADLDDMLEAIGNAGRSNGDINGNLIQWREFDVTSTDNPYITTGVDTRFKSPVVSVFHGTWKSYKQIGYLSYTDPETGEVIEDIVDETYKPMDGENVVWDWIIEWWEGYRIGQNIYVGIKPIEYQDISIDNPNAQRGVYTGAIYGTDSSDNKSLVDIMKPLQYIYLILWYRLELTLARDKGKIFMMDITQIPKGLGIDEYKWMHYLTSMGVSFINPYDEGWNIPGREGGKASAMNQMTSIDMSMSNVVAEYINLMEKVESMIGELSGVSKARQGQIHQSSLVGNVQQEITQSSHITEPLFWKHNQIKRRAYTNLLNVAKFCYKTYGKKSLNFIFGGVERMFIEISEDFLYSDYDVFLTDSTKEHQNLQFLRNLYQPAMQNGATLLDVAEIMSEDNLSEIKKKLSDIERKRAEMMRQAQEAEQAMAQQESQLKQEELRIKEEDSIRKAETAINVALIGAENKNTESIEVEEPEDNSLEFEKINIQKDKVKKDYEVKTKQLSETERHNKATEGISKIAKKTVTKPKK